MRKQLTAAVLAILLMVPAGVLAKDGDAGFDGGITSGEAPNRVVYDYQEPVFVSGTPVLMKGSVTIKRQIKGTATTTTYTYALKNTDKNATLARVVSFSATQTTRSNGQITEDAVITGKPTETIKIGSTQWTLSSYDFSRSRLIDPAPGVNYAAGDMWSKKVYAVGTGTTSTTTMTVENTGRSFGFEDGWSSGENASDKILLTSETMKDSGKVVWTGSVALSSGMSVVNHVKYMENIPDAISFDGGYLKVQNNQASLTYTAQLPEFDKDGNPTNRVKTWKDNLAIETFPVQSRLMNAALPGISGHFNEEDMNLLAAFEILKQGDSFDPERYITRGEFASMVNRAAKELTAATKTTSTAKKPVATFLDTPVTHPFFSDIEAVNRRNIAHGVSDGRFLPDQLISRADAISMVVNTTGLRAKVPDPSAPTDFLDNDEIPDYARPNVLAAARFGLIPDVAGSNFDPSGRLTTAEASAWVNRLLTWLREDLAQKYSDLTFN